MSALPKPPVIVEQTTARNRKNGKNNKKKGTRNEHKSMVRDRLAGAYVVRAGGSLGLFDYLALYPDFIRLVQVKTNRWPAKAEMEALHAFRAPHYGRKIVERWDDYARRPVVRDIG